MSKDFVLLYILCHGYWILAFQNSLQLNEKCLTLFGCDLSHSIMMFSGFHGAWSMLPVDPDLIDHISLVSSGYNMMCENLYNATKCAYIKALKPVYEGIRCCLGTRKQIKIFLMLM